MTRTASVPKPRRSRILELQCPECTESVRVARDELIEGAPVECLHCGTQAELRNDYDFFSREKAWYLVDPLTERDEEERRS
jgi:ribosomal protein S27E